MIKKNSRLLFNAISLFSFDTKLKIEKVYSNKIFKKGDSLIL